MKKLWWCLLLAGCATPINYKAKSTLLLSPEAQGEARILMGVGNQSAPMVVVTEDISSHPPDSSRPRILNDEALFLRAEGGLPAKIELSADISHWLNVKWQVLGDTFSESSRGNFALSVLGSFWYENEEDNDSGGLNSRYSQKAIAWRGGLVAGYRVLDPFLVYVGLQHQRHRYAGGYTVSGSHSGRYSGRAQLNVANLGLELSVHKGLVIRFEDALSVTELPAFGARRTQHSLGLLAAWSEGLSGE